MSPPVLHTPTPGVVVVARVALGLQACVWVLLVLLTVQALATLPDASDVPTVRPVGAIAGDAAIETLVMAVGLVLTLRLGARRRWAWGGAVVYHAACGVAYARFFWEMATAPAPEGMASFVAVLFGPIFLALCVAGLATLFWPRTVQYCLGGR